MTDPCIAISTTSRELLLDPEAVAEYNARLSFIRKYTQSQAPSSYEIGDPVIQFGVPSPYLAFHMTSPGQWIDVIRAEGFMQRDRDSHATEINNDNP